MVNARGSVKGPKANSVPTLRAPRGTQQPPGDSSSDEGTETIYGLLNPQDLNLPRLEENQGTALAALGEGWVVSRKFQEWPPALRWFNKHMDKYRMAFQLRTRAGTTSPSLLPQTAVTEIFCAETAQMSEPAGRGNTGPNVIEGPSPPPMGVTEGYIGMEKTEPFQRVCL